MARTIQDSSRKHLRSLCVELGEVTTRRVVDEVFALLRTWCDEGSAPAAAERREKKRAACTLWRDVQEYRIVNRLTQAELAAKLSMPRGTLARIEQGAEHSMVMHSKIKRFIDGR